jgi:transposase
MGRRSRFSGEVKERSVRLVREHGAEYASQWEAIQSIANKLGCSSETLRKWVRREEIDSGRRGGLRSEEQARVKELERENRELRRAIHPLDLLAQLGIPLPPRGKSGRIGPACLVLVVRRGGRSAAARRSARPRRSPAPRR